MQQPKHSLLWNSYGAEPNLGYLTHNQPGQMNTLYSAAEPQEDPDEFFIGSSYYSVRMQQAGDEPNYQYYPAITSELDDTTAHMLDLGLEEEETVNVNPVLAGDDGAHISDYRFHQLETEAELLRRENRELRVLMESYETQPYDRRNEFNPVTDVEEVIEEEHRTVQRKSPALCQYDEFVQCEPIASKTVGVGSFNINRYHLVDLHSEVIDKSQFPPDYWSRLEHVFRVHPSTARPLTRDVSFQSVQLENRTTATMVTPSSPRERLCFGVTVRPMTHDVGVSCVRAPTREFGCTTIETDTIVNDWVDKKLNSLSEQNRKLVAQLIRSSSRSREEFVESILKILRKDMKSVGVETKPDTRSSFTMTLSDEAVSSALVLSTPPQIRPPMTNESQMVEARPLLINKTTMTSRMLGISVAMETDNPLLRSQGTQAEPDVPDVTGCGVQTEPGPKLVDSSVDADYSRLTFSTVQNDHAQKKPIPSEYPKLQSAHDEELSKGLRSTRRRANSYDTNGDFNEKIVRSGSTFSHSIHLQASRPMSPAEVRDLFPAYFSSTSISPSSKSTPTEANNSAVEQSAHVTTHPDGYTLSSERRVVDEQSVRRLLPVGVDLNELARGGSAAIEDALSRSKPMGSSHVVREFHPTIEVIHHEDDADSSLRARFSADGISKAFVEAHNAEFTSDDMTTFEKKVHNIPVVWAKKSGESVQSSQTSTDSTITVQVVVGQSDLLENSNLTDAGGVALPVHIHSSNPDSMGPTTPTLSSDKSPQFTPDVNSNPEQSIAAVPVLPMQSTTSDEHLKRREIVMCRLPLRNNSFTMPEEAVRACEALKDYYLSGRSPGQDSAMVTELTKLSTLWFDMTASSSSTTLAELEDFLATLNEYHENLVRDVIQSTDDQGLTSLHLAVGHGAWPVVNLILDSGYAEPDRLNRAGYSPIMISALGTTPSTSALATLNRLFTLGDVNLRSAAGSCQTTLMLAAQNHAVEVLELLLLHNASVNAQDKAGNTALMFAIQQSDRDIVTLLLDRPELNLSLRDNRGEDALTIALRRGDPSIIEWVRNAIKYGCRRSAVFAVPDSYSNQAS